MDDETISLNVLTFRIGEEHYAANVLDIHKVVQATSDIVPVPGAPEHVLGVMNLRGSVITVLDLRQAVGLPPEEDDTRPIIVANIDQRTIGLMVDAVATVTEIDQGKIEPPPELGRSANEGLVQGLVHRDEALYLVMDLSRLPVSDEELQPEEHALV